MIVVVAVFPGSLDQLSKFSSIPTLLGVFTKSGIGLYSNASSTLIYIGLLFVFFCLFISVYRLHCLIFKY